MHVSLDSALGRQRRLNSVGESVLQIAPNAAAAYSLRSLTGGDPKVVRVRRGSDNHEQDFTASEVSSGALTSFVNAQVTPPLDIKALTATGRDGDFLIAKAAYSLRSLGTRQATLAATGDTVARADGKFVAQVRRSSDDALKSFTADEVTNGTLLAFVNEDVTIYQSDFSAGIDGFTATSTTTATGNQDGVSDSAGTSKDNVLKVVKAADSQAYLQRDQGVVAGLTYTVSGSFFAPSANTTVDGIMIKDGLAGSSLSDYPSGYLTSDGTWTDFSFSYTATTDGNQRVQLGISSLGSNPNGSSTGSTGDIVYIADLKFVQTTSNGFVKTWYDQSVDAGGSAHGNHLVQATVAEQPKIVSAGSLVTGGLRFDDAQSLETAGTFTFGDGTTLSTFITNSSDGDETSYILRFLSNYIIFINSVGQRRVNAGTFTSAGSVSGNEELWSTISTLNSSGGTTNFFVDGTLESSPDASIGTKVVSPARNLNIGGTSSGNHWNGTVNEVIFYDTDQTDNRIAIEANIGEAYNIDLPSGVDPRENQVDGFVETWYDQSGNGRDSINTTATQQPIIVDAGVFQDGLKFTHTDTTNGKRLFVPRSAAALGEDFALIWVGKVTESDTSFNNLLGGTRGVQGYAAGTAGISIKSSDGTIAFINEESTTSRVSSLSSTTTTLNEDSVVFATYEDAGAGPSLDLSVDGNHQNFSVSGYTLTSTKDIGIMNATGATGGYRTQESPTGVCREVLVYDTNQNANRVALETNINNQYDLF